jgi:hypothetical protein
MTKKTTEIISGRLQKKFQKFSTTSARGPLVNIEKGRQWIFTKLLNINKSKI